MINNCEAILSITAFLLQHLLHHLFYFILRVRSALDYVRIWRSFRYNPKISPVRPII